jgi:glycerol-1-phosphate dehydrogenase [NAD(P)+]
VNAALPVNPCDLDTINAQARSWVEPHRVVTPIAIDEVIIDDNGIDAMVDSVRSRAGSAEVVLAHDHTPMRRGADDLKALVANRLAERGRVRSVWVGDPHHPLHADVATADRLAPELQDCSVIVVVGSGSVTDVVKFARDRHRPDAALVSMPTAASVTAYTSSLAVLIVDGVKRTLPARAPDAVYCDLEVLRAAPTELTLAGFGDILARSVSGADWWLADALGMAAGYSALPSALLAAHEARLLEHPADVTTTGIKTLVESVLLAGMAMSLVDQTAPLSGWEHVISHDLDLQAAAAGRGTALHGAQVGVATLVSARAYETAWEELEVGRLLCADEASFLEPVDSRFGRLEPSGRLLAEIRRDLRQKLDAWHRAQPARERFVKDYSTGALNDSLRRRLRSSSQLHSALSAAGAAVHFADLNPAVGSSAALDTLCHAHLVRSRFTLGDLLAMCHWTTPRNMSRLLDGPDVST